ncbi:unnamed protein product [Camellia sinensis]
MQSQTINLKPQPISTTLLCIERFGLCAISLYTIITAFISLFLLTFTFLMELELGINALHIKLRATGGNKTKTPDPEFGVPKGGDAEELSSTVEVPCNSLSVGDQIVILPGDCVPGDGIVRDGRSAVDESSFTGEPLPVTKLPGEILLKLTETTEEKEAEKMIRKKILEMSEYLVQIRTLEEESEKNIADQRKMLEEKEGLMVQVKDLEREVDSLRNQNSDLEEQLRSKNHEIDQMLTEMERLQDRISKLEEDYYVYEIMIEEQLGVQEEEETKSYEDDDDDDFEFPCVCEDPTSPNKIFYNGQIIPVFPIFGRDLLFSDVENCKGEMNSSKPPTPSPIRIPLAKLMSEDRDPPSCSSSEADKLNGVPSPERCKKSNLMGSSKRWKFRDLLYRSNSNSKDTFVFLVPSNTNSKKKNNKKASKRATKVKVARKVKPTVAGGGVTVA